ncbi:DNA replication and repair protein RecF [gut metagenome]|uniref:DNA replication and repair protein RecF n=1 Tax=gut metagenome TaxID=749906 RepID=J9GE27_9ZZZZ
MKLAQFVFLDRRGNTRPILLLDDIFDKLDANRVEQIIKLVSGNGFGQIFITDTNRKHLDEILLAIGNDHSLFRVEHGNVKVMEE